MMISTKGRYALRVMLDLAEQGTDGLIPLTDIARRQDISEKYLESVVSLLVKGGLLLASRGKGGGYRLSRAPEDYTVSEILRTAEGDFAPVACLASDAKNCARAEQCKTVKLWAGLYRHIDAYLSGVTLADVMNGTIETVPDGE